MYKRKLFRLHLRSGILRLGERTLIMGVLNITPDSFSDGGEFLDPKLALKQALAMQRDGADIIDIGAESTRPGSEGISAPEELRRLLPVLEAVRGRLKIPVSVDTQKSAVAEIALGAGAQILNDVSGLRGDPRIAKVAAKHGAPLILMHMRGNPRSMQKGRFARDVLQVGAPVLGLLLMAPGAGAIVGGLSLASVRRFPKPHRLLMFLEIVLPKLG